MRCPTTDWTQPTLARYPDLLRVHSSRQSQRRTPSLNPQSSSVASNLSSFNLHSLHSLPQTPQRSPTNMITDTGLYTLAIFLGSAAMLMIVLYHFLEINAKDAEPLSKERKADALPAGKGRS
ncbi:Oligosaccaryltransferase-domain-containing protein [Phyllosticta citricarpa]